jgi:predicted nucleic acid-binding protein
MPGEFVDTNILVYAYDRTAETKFDRARELMEKLWDSGEGVVSTQVVEEFYVTVTAKIPHGSDQQRRAKLSRTWVRGELQC